VIYEKSYTRVTLALDILRRIDSGPLAGYHDLGVVKHQVDLSDIVGVASSPEMKIRCSDSRVPCDASNICWKAAMMLKDRFGISENVVIDIEKHIPVEGGLAGGSANAATTMLLLCRLWGLEPGPGELQELGAQAGRDVPYFFTGGTCFDTETGLVEPVTTEIPLDLVLAVPPFGVSTREAYGRIDYRLIARQRHHTDTLIRALLRNDVDGVAQSMHNDFERIVFAMHPRCAQLKQELLDAGCLGAVMSGSGSTVVGIARDKEHAREVCDRLSVRGVATGSLKRDD
jgi:4-diphosphocytidyl-2-C-methyl-D-erythritol kinase